MTFPWSRRRDRELDEELRAHLRMAVEERVARGERREDAELAARREFGNLGVVQEVTREMRGGGWLERLAQDVRYGVRTLRRSPAFTIVAGLTLALGIGATTAMFTVVHAVLLRPLPYPQADRLVRLAYGPQTSAFDFISAPAIADHQWVEYRRRQRLLARVGASKTLLTTLTGAGDPVQLPGAAVTAGFLETLGIRPTMGRAFSVDDETPGAPPVVLLGDALWRGRFGSNARIVGSDVVLDGIRHIVIGVLPAGFSYPSDAQLWEPLVVKASPNMSISWLLTVVGRLGDGVTPAQVTAELASIARAGPRRGGEAERDTLVARVVPLKDTIVKDATLSLLVFAGAVGLVLLISCANVANLLLMRATSRQREMAVRAALGAGRRRLMRQLVTESAILWLAAGAIGVMLAVAGVRALLALAPPGRIPRQDEIGVDTTALAFALGVSLVTGVVFGLAPALRATRSPLRESLAASSRNLSTRDGGVRGVLVVAEVALALILLAGAGLMAQSFLRMRHVELGFRPAGLVTMTVDLPPTTYRSATAMHAFNQAMLERLAHMPGATSAAAVNYSPLGTSLIRGDFQLEGGRKPPRDYVVAKLVVTPGYFPTMGIRLLAGREFAAGDAASAPGVVIVSKLVADRIWPGESAVGKRVSMRDRPGAGDWLTVIGVVDDVTQKRLDENREPAMYQPTLQTSQAFFLNHMSFVVRATGDPRSLIPAMRRALKEVDANQAISSIRTMDDTILETVAEPLFQARLIGAFSVFALLLAGIGIYGVIAYSVAERTHEIGIRVALGAGRGNVVRLVLWRILILVIPGLVIGVAGALAATRLLSTLLFAVKPNDPTTFAAVVLLLACVAFVAGLLPARRASRVDPLVALRVGG